MKTLTISEVENGYIVTISESSDQSTYYNYEAGYSTKQCIAIDVFNVKLIIDQELGIHRLNKA